LFVKLPIDTSVLTFLCTLPPEPVMNRETKTQRADANGEPLNQVQLVAIGGAEGGQMVTVKFPGTPAPGFRQQVAVKVSGLVVSDWDIDGRHGLSFRAATVEPLNGSAPAPKGGAGA
jgi:hypothetical protein